jgi:hypothetical protein
MNAWSWTEIRDRVRLFGRVYEDAELGAVFFNWTCSGFELDFHGTRLEGRFLALETEFETRPGAGAQTFWPWIAVFLDDGVEPYRRFEVGGRDERHVLFESETPEKHRLKVVKLSENFMGKSGLAGLRADGEISAPSPVAPACRIEFIGDSITCGYGNEAEDRDAPFMPAQQNGWMTYAALACRELNAECQMVSMSGISVSQPTFETPFKLPSMDELYAYTDRLHETRRGKQSGFAEWDFGSFRPDAIVINLGTNDVNAVKLAEDKSKEEDAFERNYIRFLREVRRRNGPEPVIYCTLGPLDYYLYDRIVRAAAGYAQETGDTRIRCFKWGGVVQWEEGYGAVGHPSVKTHLRMGKELCGKLREGKRSG